VSSRTEQHAAKKRRRSEITFLRLIPGTSPVHRLWAGTKLIIVAILSITASLRPTWLTLITVASIVFAGFAVGRVPATALPRLPRWFFLMLAISAVLSVRSTAPPIVHFATQDLSLGGLEEWARLTLLTALLVLSAGLVGWTTPLGEIAPALARLTRPLRWTRLPFDEWITAVALSIRSLPILVDEAQTLFAARRLRKPVVQSRTRHGLRRAAREFNNLLVVAIRTTIRHAEDVGDAIEARGGSHTFGDEDGGARRGDYLVVLAILAIAAVLIII
jgi:energy-coupling factor transporter transmembrane protein EcfT